MNTIEAFPLQLGRQRSVKCQIKNVLWNVVEKVAREDRNATS